MITVTGLSSDRYLINNKIIIELSSDVRVDRFTITFLNTNNTKSSSNIVVYPSPVAGTAQLNISPIIKSLFEYPADADGYVIPNQLTKNANNITITVTSTGHEPVAITKTFIRGGKKGKHKNLTLSANAVCRPAALLPIWTGYDTANYVLNGSNEIVKKLLSSVDLADRDYRRVRSCNGLYVKFLNQLGGYCHWLFESYSETESNNNLGSFERDNNVDDLGNESNSKLKMYSKVPAEYKGYVKDLIVSPEIYAMNDEGVFVRVLSARNSFEIDKNKRSYNVTINMDIENSFNPSLLWSN